MPAPDQPRHRSTLTTRDVPQPLVSLSVVLQRAHKELALIPRLMMMARAGGKDDAQIREWIGEDLWPLAELAIAQARKDAVRLPNLAFDRRYTGPGGEQVIVRGREMGQVWLERPDGPDDGPPRTMDAYAFHARFTPTTPEVRFGVTYRFEGDLVRVVATGGDRCQCHVLDPVTHEFLSVRFIDKAELLAGAEVVRERPSA